MTTVRKNPINASNFANFGEPKVNKRYDDTPAQNVADEIGTTVEAMNANPNGVSFEKPAQTDLFDLPEEQPVQPQASPAGEKSAAERRAEKRQEWKDANKTMQRALQMQKEAQAKLAQAQRFEQVAKTAHENPVEVAKALGMTPEEFLRKYQNQMFNIPEPKPELDPQEQMKQRFEQYEQERKREREEHETFKAQTIRQNYISTKIMPIITGDPDRFELLNYNNAELSASYMYDLMDAHYRQTGEEWSAQDVAEAYENELQKELEDKLSKIRGVKKFSKHFREATDAPGQEITIPAQLGEDTDPTAGIQRRNSVAQNQANNPGPLGSGPNTITDVKTTQGPVSRATISNPLSSVPAANENAYQRQASWDRKRESRLNKVVEVTKRNGITRNT